MELGLCGYKVLIDDEDYEMVSSLRWRVVPKNTSGQVYFMTWHENKRIRLHRFILGQKNKNIFVDHINGNTLDNRKSNLRNCTQNENQRNCRKHRDNKTGLKGIYYQKEAKKYHAQIMVNSKVIYLGLFTNKEEAHAAYCEASKKYHGEFGRTE